LENGQDIEERTGLDFWCFLFVKLRLGFENGALTVTARWKNAGDSSSIGQKDGQWPGLPMSSET